MKGKIARKIQISCLLLLFSMVVGSINCAAETEYDDSWVWDLENCEWEDKIWSEEWGKARERTSDNTGRVPEGKTITVPEGVTKLTWNYLNPYYHDGGDLITGLILPESLREIEATALARMYYLRELTIPSGVTKIDKESIFSCPNLRIIRNLSNQSVFIDTNNEESVIRYGGPIGLEYYVDGQKLPMSEFLEGEILPGKTAVAKYKNFTLNYNLKGGKLVGKKVNSYHIGQDIKLPKAKKKGYTFLGWSLSKSSYSTWFTLYNENGQITGHKKLVARFKKIQAKKIGKKKIRITLKNREVNDNTGSLVCFYSTNKNMRNKKMIHLGLEHMIHPKDMRAVYTEKTKDYTNKIYSNKKTSVCDLKNLKKGKTYYLQFRRIECMGPVGYYCIHKKVLKNIKIKL